MDCLRAIDPIMMVISSKMAIASLVDRLQASLIAGVIDSGSDGKTKLLLELESIAVGRLDFGAGVSDRSCGKKNLVATLSDRSLDSSTMVTSGVSEAIWFDGKGVESIDWQVKSGENIRSSVCVDCSIIVVVGVIEGSPVPPISTEI